MKTYHRLVILLYQCSALRGRILPLPPCFFFVGLSRGKKRHDAELTARPPFVRVRSRQGPTLGMVSTLSGTQDSGPSSRGMSVWCGSFHWNPENEEYLLNIHRHALRFEARGPNRKSYDFIIVLSSIHGDDIHIVKGSLCGG